MLSNNRSLLILTAKKDLVKADPTREGLPSRVSLAARGLAPSEQSLKNVTPALGAVEAPINRSAKRTPLTVHQEVLRKDSLNSFVYAHFKVFTQKTAKFLNFLKVEALQSKTTGDNALDGRIDRLESLVRKF